MPFKSSFERKKAISPVLATVILISITLIAATAVSGFVFGLFGTFTSTAVVSASGSSSCSGTPESCTLFLSNTGSSNVAVTGVCRLNFGGSSYLGTASIVSGSLNAGRQATVSCVSSSPGSHATSGTQITGSVAIGNGAQVLFAATAA
jgi:flagellin-like protein